MERFPDNSRVCFVGDSITHNNKYLMHIVACYKEHFPKANINYVLENTESKEENHICRKSAYLSAGAAPTLPAP